jgi:hypothetical protein
MEKKAQVTYKETFPQHTKFLIQYSAIEENKVKPGGGATG